MSQGEYIAPEKIENIYVRSPFISQVYIYGDSQHHVLVGLVVLEEEPVKRWLSEQGKNVDATLPLDQNLALKEAVLKDMNQYGKQHGLMPYEQVKSIRIIMEPFTMENGLLTPTFKARRHAVEKKYQHLFQDMYKQLKNP